jgi:hypothetical protein
MKEGLPSIQVRTLVLEADQAYRCGDWATTKTKLNAAFALKQAVEQYAGQHWYDEHNTFTVAMLDMAELWFKINERERDLTLASHAQAWADDPCCGGNQRHFERSFTLRHNASKYQWLGRLQKLRSLLPI